MKHLEHASERALGRLLTERGDHHVDRECADPRIRFWIVDHVEMFFGGSPDVIHRAVPLTIVQGRRTRHLVQPRLTEPPFPLPRRMRPLARRTSLQRT